MHAANRRHGEGQRTANATFRHFVLDMIAKHADDAKKGISHFESNPERKKVMVAVHLTYTDRRLRRHFCKCVEPFQTPACC